MEALEHKAYMALREGAQVLEADHYGDKVLRLSNGNFLKLFRRKRLLTSAAWLPYAQRFANNALVLQELGIPCPKVLAVYRIKSIERDAVYYMPLEGRTLRQLFEETEQASGLHALLGKFVAQLHEQGVYFRSLHLGNIVLTPDNKLGLIDIADLKYQHKSLSASKRIRNFRHMLRNSQDNLWLMSDNCKLLFEHYIPNSKTRINIADIQKMTVHERSQDQNYRRPN